MILSSIHELMSYIIFRSNHYIKAYNFVMEQAKKEYGDYDEDHFTSSVEYGSEDDGYLNEWQ